MKEYIVTFFTHFDAIKCRKTLEENAIDVRLGPVPRDLSSSCGTCAMFKCEFDYVKSFVCDAEQVYTIENANYSLLLDNR